MPNAAFSDLRLHGCGRAEPGLLPLVGTASATARRWCALLPLRPQTRPQPRKQPRPHPFLKRFRRAARAARRRRHRIAAAPVARPWLRP